MKNLELLIIILVVFLAPVSLVTLNPALAAQVHYVSDDGATTTDAWSNSTKISTPCDLSVANSNASAGDTVYILDDGGDFSTSINPSNSGSSGNPITFIAYPGHSPCLYQTARVDLTDKSYITIDEVVTSL